MAKAKNEVAEVKKRSMIPVAPEFVKQAEVAGVEDLGQYIIPPRLKVIQGSSKAPFSEMFNPGDAVMVPQMMIVAPIDLNDHGRPGQTGGVFHVVPLFFYAEWCLWNPIELKGSKPAIVSRTTDPTHAMVIRSRDPKLRQEPIVGEYDSKGNQLCQRHVEHLNYICVIIDADHDLHGMPFVLSFSRGDHRSGSNLAALIKLRKAPIYACRMQARVAFRPDAKGDWFGLDVVNPEDGGAWVNDEIMFNAFKEMHEEFKQAHAAGMIQADYTDDTDERTIDVTKTEF